MSVILGINCLHADSSACLIKDGKLLFAIEEERINREKHSSDLPVQSIRECLKQTSVSKMILLTLLLIQNQKVTYS